MRAYQIPEMEAKFAKTLTDSYGKKFKLVPGTLPNVTGIRPPEQTYYYRDIIKKDQIVLHHTAGVLMGDIGALTQPNNHVSTAYVIARSGVVYELFDPAAYSYHLGPNATGGNSVRSQKTIAIEISNIGQLREDAAQPGVLIDAYNKPYCYKKDTEFYVERPFRGYKYYATYTEEQYKSLDSLLLNLCRKFAIPHTFLPEGQRLLHQTKIPAAGIVSHVNYRTDKTDVSTAFDFSKIGGR